MYLKVKCSFFEPYRKMNKETRHIACSYEQVESWKQFLFSSGCAGIPGNMLARLLDTFVLNFS